MKKCLEQPGKGKLAPYDKERFDLKKELAREELLGDIQKSITTQP